MKAIGYAFWGYDLFPYFLGAEFVELKGKRVRVPSYGENSWVKPKFVLGLAAGKELKQSLETLTHEYNQAKDSLHADFKKKLDSLVTACSRNRGHA